MQERSVLNIMKLKFSQSDVLLAVFNLLCKCLASITAWLYCIPFQLPGFYMTISWYMSRPDPFSISNQVCCIVLTLFRQVLMCSKWSPVSIRPQQVNLNASPSLAYFNQASKMEHVIRFLATDTERKINWAVLNCRQWCVQKACSNVILFQLIQLNN